MCYVLGNLLGLMSFIGILQPLRSSSFIYLVYVGSLDRG